MGNRIIAGDWECAYKYQQNISKYAKISKSVMTLLSSAFMRH